MPPETVPAVPPQRTPYEQEDAPMLPPATGDAPLLPPDAIDPSAINGAAPDNGGEAEEVVPESLKRFLRKAAEPDGTGAPAIEPQTPPEPVGLLIPNQARRYPQGGIYPVIAPLPRTGQRPSQTTHPVSNARSAQRLPSASVRPGYPMIAPLPPAAGKPSAGNARPARPTATEQPPQPEQKQQAQTPPRRTARLVAPDLKKPTTSVFRRASRSGSSQTADGGLSIVPQ